MRPALESLMERKVAQWTLGYLVAAWGFVEAFGFLAELFGWGDGVVRSAVVLLAAGVPAVVILSWFHGRRGRQRVTATEAGLLSLVGIGGVLGAVLVGPPDGPLSPDGAGPESLDPTASYERSLAVLPPTDLGGDPEQAYFAAGMHEALISQISRVGGLRVISRTSAARFGDAGLSLPEIARELGVDDVVEASLLRTGDSVRVEVRLVEAAPEERLRWSGTFRTELRDVASMHAEVARAIAREVRVELSPDERSRLGAVRTVDPGTYEAYLRGMHELTRGGSGSVERGLAYLHDAVDRDPADALAYAGLAIGYATLGHGPAPPAEAWPRARAAALRAVTLDPDLAEAHAALADVKLYWEWDWEGAEREFRIANRLNPNLAMNRYHYAWYLILFGRMEEALVQHRLAKELDPLTPLHTAWLGGLYLWAGRPEEALVEAEAALELGPDSPPTLLVLGDVYAALERYDEAIAVHRRFAANTPAGRWILGTTLARAGMEREARRIRDELEAGEPIPWDAFGLILLNAHLGDYDRAFRWLDHEPMHAWLPWVRNSHWTVSLRADPRFDAFLERLDLPPLPDGAARRAP